ncbi:MAG TPA: cupin domain-containing protein [Allosphingosinicella sp.]|jgi:mannose-6-phosphate isomerase-like protein (cupin superfamily)|nr:cupin domain-containing protein [Allosphingosinicella sp.]
MSVPPAVNLAEKLALFSDHWNPRIVGRYNDNEVRVSKLKGEFVWHSHAETDELFLVLKGRLTIEFRDGVRTLGPGEFLVVSKGVEHRPVAPEEVELLIMDREGEPNTGDAISEHTRAGLEAL